MSARVELTSLSLNSPASLPGEAHNLDEPVQGMFFAPVKPHFSARALFNSAAIHAAILSFCLYPPLQHWLDVPLIVQENSKDAHITPADSEVMMRVSYLQAVALTPAPPSATVTQQIPKATSSSDIARATETPAKPEEKPSALQTYSGPQEIVSALPDSTNSVQTIRRPDLVNPPKLKFPQLVQSQISPPPTAVVIPELKPVDLVAVPETNLRVDEAAVAKPKLKLPTSPLLPSKPAQPQPPAEIKPVMPVSSQAAAIVINAVTVPEDAPSVIPQAELSGSFVVHATSISPSHAAPSAGESTASKAIATTATSQEGAKKEGGGEPSPKPSEVNPANKTTGAEISLAGNTPGVSLNSNGSKEANTAAQSVGGRSQGTQPVPGITILGGTSRGGTRLSGHATASSGYGITVISSGSNGGASRDTGYFARNERVYTIYIPMADAGGGPDWSMQYAMLGQSSSGSGMLTPPVAVKKIPAILTGDSMVDSQTRIFFPAIISELGELTVKPLLQMDARAQQALETLRRWQFLPAQMDGKPVGAKVLIGVATVSR